MGKIDTANVSNIGYSNSWGRGLVLYLESIGVKENDRYIFVVIRDEFFGGSMKRWTSILSVILASSLMVLVYQNCAEEVDLSKYTGESKKGTLITVEDTEILENQSGTVTIQRNDSNLGQDVAISWAIVASVPSSLNGRFENTTGIATLLAGQLSASINVKSVKNNIIESDIEYGFQVEANSDGKVESHEVILKVVENDESAPPPVVISNTHLLSLGRDHACGVISGRLSCWGYNGFFHLGTGDQVNRMQPTYVRNIGDLVNSGKVTDVSVGKDVSCAVVDGALYCWGRNSEGQMAEGVTTGYGQTPTTIDGLETGVTRVSVGMLSICAIKNEALYCWGYETQGNLRNGNHGNLGNGNQGSKNTIGSPVENMGSGVLDVATGGYFNGSDYYGHTCAIKRVNNSGQLYCWGYNGNGQLGIGSATTANYADQITPQQVPGLDSNVTQVSVDGVHTCAVQNGAAKCWGYNAYGQLGINSTTNPNNRGYSYPQVVQGLSTGTKSIAVGEMHTCAIHNDTVKCWGNNDQFQLGIGGTSTNPQVAPVTLEGFIGITELSADFKNTCAIQKINGVTKNFCWGHNEYRKIGNNSTTSRFSSPQEIIAPIAP